MYWKRSRVMSSVTVMLLWDLKVTTWSKSHLDPQFLQQNRVFLQLWFTRYNRLIKSFPTDSIDMFTLRALRATTCTELQLQPLTTSGSKVSCQSGVFLKLLLSV